MLRFVRGYATKFRPGDMVIIRPLRKGVTPKKWLSNALESGKKLNIDTGSFPHEEIIGTYPRSRIYETRGKKLFKYIVSAPTTEEYINMTGRDAQPIYPYDASSMVALADIHMDFPEVDAAGNLVNPPFQYFEAGTGHGSLTLQICKAIHSANAYAKFSGDPAKRGAILHSLDCNERHSKTGQRTIAHFHNGMYKSDVEFHIAESPSEWLENEASEWRALWPRENEESGLEEKQAFLSGAFLDMGGFEKHLETVSKNLLLDAPLLIFCPSLTQVMDALKLIDANPDIRLQFVRTIQLPPGVGGGLKEWDTRKTFIKATGEEGWVCRPKVGIRVCGGGFILIFKKPTLNIDIHKELQEIKDYIPEPKEEYAPGVSSEDMSKNSSQAVSKDASVELSTDSTSGTPKDEHSVQAANANADKPEKTKDDVSEHHTSQNNADCSS